MSALEGMALSANSIEINWEQPRVNPHCGSQSRWKVIQVIRFLAPAQTAHPQFQSSCGTASFLRSVV